MGSTIGSGLRLYRLTVLLAGLSCAVVAGCAAGSSGGSTLSAGTFGVQPGGTSVFGSTGDCTQLPEFNIDAQNEARAAPHMGLRPATSAAEALQTALTDKSGLVSSTSGSSLVDEGYPYEDWTEVAVASNSATFQAPLLSGSAQLTLTRVGSQWWLSHGQKNC